jgi:hypothetical protein
MSCLKLKNSSASAASTIWLRSANFARHLLWDQTVFTCVRRRKQSELKTNAVHSNRGDQALEQVRAGLQNSRTDPPPVSLFVRTEKKRKKRVALHLQISRTSCARCVFEGDVVLPAGGCKPRLYWTPTLSTRQPSASLSIGLVAFGRITQVVVSFCQLVPCRNPAFAFVSIKGLRVHIRPNPVAIILEATGAGN